MFPDEVSDVGVREGMGEGWRQGLGRAAMHRPTSPWSLDPLSRDLGVSGWAPDITPTPPFL